MFWKRCRCTKHFFISMEGVYLKTCPSNALSASQTFFFQRKWKFQALFLGLFDHHPMIHSTQLHVKVQAIAVGHGTNPGAGQPHLHPVPAQSKQTLASRTRTL